MCGIAGVYERNGSALDSEAARSMGLTMTHRGPDNFGVSSIGSVAMSHNRLSLLDLSDAASQPFGDSRYLLSYNGEIYNFKEIRSGLERDHGVRFRTASDTEVLYFSLIHDGVDKCLSKIEGMFAFSFYDRAADRLLLARDRLGIKPLYYYESNGAIYWASEVKAIASALDLTPDPIRTLFATNNMGEKSVEYTLFKGIRSVEPGTFLSFNKSGEGSATVYFDVVDAFDKDYYADLNRESRKSITEHFDRLFTESVRKMLVADAPVGAFVSGGVDSSFISAIASRQQADISLFTANVVGKYSELGDVELLAKHLDRQVFEEKFEPAMILRDWAKATYHYDCPIVVHVNAIPFSNVARLARDSGMKAVLTGEGADELFVGYPPLVANRYRTIAKLPVNLVKSLYNVSPQLRGFLFPENTDSPLRFINRLVQGYETSRLEGRAEQRLSFLNERDRRDQFLTIGMIREHLVTLLHRNDRMGMMASIEARFPFLDEAIVKFAINLPTRFKIGFTPKIHNYKHPFLMDKWIVRETAAKYLPAAIAMKVKNGFPMFGHKFLKMQPEFFENGWVQESLALSKRDFEYLLSAENPYFIAKLASVEVFGRIFGQKEELGDVQEHIFRNAQLIGVDSSSSSSSSNGSSNGVGPSRSRALEPVRKSEQAADPENEPAWLREMRTNSRDRYFSSDGHAWVRFHRWAFMRFPPHEMSKISKSEEREVFFKRRAALLSHHYLPVNGEKANSILYLCSDKEYDISKLSANNRSKVRRAEKRLTVRQATPLELAAQGYACYRDTCTRNGLTPIAEEIYSAKWNQSTGADHRELWAAFAGDEMAAISVVWICGSQAEIFSAQSSNKYLKDYPNHALFYNILNNLLHRDGIESVSYGLSSLQEESKKDSLHHFKMSINFQAIPVVRRITVNPILRPVFNKMTLKTADVLGRLFPGKRHMLAAKGALALIVGKDDVSSSLGA